MSFSTLTKSPAPVCAWCGCDTLPETGYRGSDPAFAEFQGTVGVVVCTPACPDRPDDATVWARPGWRWDDHDMLELSL